MMSQTVGWAAVLHTRPSLRARQRHTTRDRRPTRRSRPRPQRQGGPVGPRSHPTRTALPRRDHRDQDQRSQRAAPGAAHRYGCTHPRAAHRNDVQTQVEKRVALHALQPQKCSSWGRRSGQPRPLRGRGNLVLNPHPVYRARCSGCQHKSVSMYLCFTHRAGSARVRGLARRGRVRCRRRADRRLCRR